MNRNVSLLQLLLVKIGGNGQRGGSGFGTFHVYFGLMITVLYDLTVYECV